MIPRRPTATTCSARSARTARRTHRRRAKTRGSAPSTRRDHERSLRPSTSRSTLGGALSLPASEPTTSAGLGQPSRALAKATTELIDEVTTQITSERTLRLGQDRNAPVIHLGEQAGYAAEASALCRELGEPFLSLATTSGCRAASVRKWKTCAALHRAERRPTDKRTAGVDASPSQRSSTARIEESIERRLQVASLRRCAATRRPDDPRRAARQERFLVLSAREQIVGAANRSGLSMEQSFAPRTVTRSRAAASKMSRRAGPEPSRHLRRGTRLNPVWAFSALLRSAFWLNHAVLRDGRVRVGTWRGRTGCARNPAEIFLE